MKKGQNFVPVNHLGKYIALMLKFPQLIRWLQWDSENKSGVVTSATIKAQLLDDAITELIEKVKEDDMFKIWSDETFWLQMEAKIPANLKALLTLQTGMPWLRSQGLLKILLIDKKEGVDILNALKCNIW